MTNRRSFLQKALGLGVGALTAAGAFAQHEHITMPARHEHSTSDSAAPVVVQTPGVADLPWRMIDGAKEFHLIAEPVKQQLVPGRTLDLWGFNGSAPGPTIQVNHGDRVRIIVDNHLPEPTSMH